MRGEGEREQEREERDRRERREEIGKRGEGRG